MIIDFHTHAFPDSLAPRALEALLENALRYEEIYGGASTYTDGTFSGLAAASENAGIDISVVMPIATTLKQAAKINDTAAMADRIPGLRSYGSVHPMSPGVLDEIETIHSLGLKGIKLHPDYQDFFVDCAESVAVIKKAIQLELCVLLHAGEDIGFLPPFHCTPDRIVRMVDAIGEPDAKIILAHMGGYRLWEDVLKTLPSLGLYIDTSHSIAHFPEKHSVFAEIIHAFGADHVLFGSDSPWADQRKTLETTRQFLNAYGFSESDQEKIFGTNAMKFI